MITSCDLSLSSFLCMLDNSTSSPVSLLHVRIHSLSCSQESLVHSCTTCKYSRCMRLCTMTTQTSKRISHTSIVEILLSFDSHKISLSSTKPRFQKKYECFKSIHTDTDFYSVPIPLQQFPCKKLHFHVIPSLC